MTLVVDASVAFKWFLADEPDAAKALAIVQDGTALIAPDILIAEVCNAAWRSARLGRISQDQVKEIAAILPRFFDLLVGAAALARRAVALAEALDHPVHDCLYVALAETRQAKLITADTRLLAKLRQSPRTAEWLYLADYEAQA